MIVLRYMMMGSDSYRLQLQKLLAGCPKQNFTQPTIAIARQRNLRLKKDTKNSWKRRLTQLLSLGTRSAANPREESITDGDLALRVADNCAQQWCRRLSHIRAHPFLCSLIEKSIEVYFDWPKPGCCQKNASNGADLVRNRSSTKSHVPKLAALQQ